MKDITREEFVELLKAAMKPPAVIKEDSATADVVMKVATGLSTVGVAGLFGLLFSFMGDIRELSTKQEFTNKQIELLQAKLDDFTKAPRFTKEMFDAEVAPLKRRIEVNEIALSGRGEWMDKINARLSKVETEAEYRGRK